MPSMKPGMWAVTPAHIDPEYQNFWSGLVFCAPLWERSGPPIDLITKTFGVISGTPTMVNIDTGIAARGNGGAGWVWAAHETHDRIPAADSWTFIALFQRYSGDENSFIFGYGVDTVLPTLDAAGMWGDTAERLRPVCGNTLQNCGSYQQDVTELSVVRWDGGTLEGFRYELDGQLLNNTSSAASTNVTTGGQFGLNDSADGPPGGSHDYAVVYAWDRLITDDEIRLLLADPFGPIRPVPISIEEAAVSGAGAIAEVADNASGVGTVLVSGSGAISEQPDDATGTGTILVSGAGAISEQADSVSGAGSVLVSGSGAVAEQPDDASGAGSTAITGSGTITEASDDATGAGNILISGSGAITEQPDDATGLGTSGAVAVLIPAVSVVARSRVSVTGRRRVKVTDRVRVT